MLSASGVIVVQERDDKRVFITPGSELDDGMEAFKTFAIYYLHKPENL